MFSNMKASDLGSLYCRLPARRAPSVLVKSSGERWKPSDQSRRMADACAAAKIEPPVTFHKLRDTFASYLVMAGVPILTVSKLLGHADVRVTEKHYAHLAPNYLQRAVDENLPDFSTGGRRSKESRRPSLPGSAAKKARNGVHGHARRRESGQGSRRIAQ
jgi:Phage integrase family